MSTAVESLSSKGVEGVGGSELALSSLSSVAVKVKRSSGVKPVLQAAPASRCLYVCFMSSSTVTSWWMEFTVATVPCSSSIFTRSSIKGGLTVSKPPTRASVFMLRLRWLSSLNSFEYLSTVEEGLNGDGGESGDSEPLSECIFF